MTSLKSEATFFNFEFPENYFHLRKPLFAPLGDSFSEAEIHCCLSRFGDMPTDLIEELRAPQKRALRIQRSVCSGHGGGRYGAKLAPVILYRTLGEVLPEGAAEGAVLWPLALNFALRDSDSLARAGYTGDVFEQADKPFDAIIAGHQASSSPRTTWKPYGVAWVTRDVFSL